MFINILFYFKVFSGIFGKNKDISTYEEISVFSQSIVLFVILLGQLAFDRYFENKFTSQILLPNINSTKVIQYKNDKNIQVILNSDGPNKQYPQQNISIKWKILQYLLLTGINVYCIFIGSTISYLKKQQMDGELLLVLTFSLIAFFNYYNEIQNFVCKNKKILHIFISSTLFSALTYMGEKRQLDIIIHFFIFFFGIIDVQELKNFAQIISNFFRTYQIAEVSSDLEEVKDNNIYFNTQRNCDCQYIPNKINYQEPFKQSNNNKQLKIKQQEQLDINIKDNDDTPMSSYRRPTHIHLLQTSHQFNSYAQQAQNASIVGSLVNNQSQREIILNQQSLSNSYRPQFFIKEDNKQNPILDYKNQIEPSNNLEKLNIESQNQNQLIIPQTETSFENNVLKEQNIYTKNTNDQNSKQVQKKAINQKLFENDLFDDDNAYDSSQDQQKIEETQILNQKIKLDFKRYKSQNQDQTVQKEQIQSNSENNQQKLKKSISLENFKYEDQISNSKQSMQLNLQQIKKLEDQSPQLSKFQLKTLYKQTSINNQIGLFFEQRNDDTDKKQNFLYDKQNQIYEKLSSLNDKQSSIKQSASPLKQSTSPLNQTQQMYQLNSSQMVQSEQVQINTIYNENHKYDLHNLINKNKNLYDNNQKDYSNNNCQSSDTNHNKMDGCDWFFKETLDYLDCSLFIVNENLQIIYSNNLALSMLEAINQQHSEIKMKSSKSLNNPQGTDQQKQNPYTTSQTMPIHFTDKHLQVQLVSEKQINSQNHYSPQFCPINNNNNSFSQQFNQNPDSIMKFSLNLNNDQKQQRHQTFQQQENVTYFSSNKLTLPDKIKRINDRANTLYPSRNNMNFNSKNIFSSKNESQTLLFRSITIQEFSKNSFEYLKTIGLDNYTPTIMAIPQIGTGYGKDEQMNVSNFNKNGNSINVSFSVNPNLQTPSGNHRRHHSIQGNFGINSTPMECSFLLDDVIKNEERRKKKSFNINIQELAKKIIQNLNQDNQYSVIEPVNCKVDETLEGLNLYNIKLVGKLIKNKKYVIITFSDNQEKQAHLNQTVKRNIFQTISHELGTYTNFIQTFTSTALLDETVPKIVKKNYLKYIDSNIFLLSSVVRDIRDFYENQHNALKMIWKDVNLAELLSKICKHFKKLAKLKQISFKCDVIDIPEKVCVDELKTQSVIVNLLSNAFKFTQKNGSVSIEASYKKEDDLIKISVTDKGIGMNTLEQHRLKQLLNGKQLFSKVSPNSSGFGFGLSISNIITKKLIQNAQYSTIQFHSKEKQGSTFWFHIDSGSLIKKINRLSSLKINTNQQVLQSEFNINSHKQVEEIAKPQVQQNDLLLKKEQDQLSFSHLINSPQKEVNLFINSQLNDDVQQPVQSLFSPKSLNNQQSLGQSIAASNNLNSQILVNKYPQISQFKVNSQNNNGQQSIMLNNPKILEKYIIFSNQEIIEIQESDFQDKSDLCSKIIQKDITQSQSIDNKLFDTFRQQNAAIKGKNKKFSRESFLTVSDCFTTNFKFDDLMLQQQQSKLIDYKGLPSSISPIKQKSNITQSFVINSSNKDYKKKQKEDVIITKQLEQISGNNSSHHGSIESQTEFNSSLSEIPSCENIKLQLPKYIQYKHLSPNKIMIVDDEPMNIKGLQIMMKVKAQIKEEYLITATNGIEAVDQFQKNLKSLNSIKLIFMDINMPLMDGIEATKQIRSIEKYNKLSKINIVAYTSWTDLQTKIRCSQSGMDNYFSKPISLDQLFIALNRYYFTPSVQ